MFCFIEPLLHDFSFKLVLQGLCLVLQSITSVFATFNAILFASSQNKSSFKSLFRLCVLINFRDCVLNIKQACYHLQSEKILRIIWHYEDHWYILKKEGDPEQTRMAPHIVNFVFKSQIHLLLQIAFCKRGSSIMWKFIKQYVKIYSIKCFL